MTENTKPVTLMTIHEAAKTGIMPENTLRRMCRNNEVPCLHVGRRYPPTNPPTRHRIKNMVK